MNYEEVYNKVVELVKEVLDDEDIVLTKESCQDNTVGWDSLHNISIISSIQSEFNIKLAFNEIIKIKSIDDIVKTVIEKLS